MKPARITLRLLGMGVVVRQKPFKPGRWRAGCGGLDEPGEAKAEDAQQAG